MSKNSTIKFEALRLSIFLLLLMSYILVFFHRMAPGVVAGDLMASFNTTGASLGALASMYFIIYAFMQLPSGVLADTLGVRVTIVVGNITAGVGSVIFGLADSYSIALVGRMLVGFGVSVTFISILKFISFWYSRRRFAQLVGVTGFAGNIGAIAAMGPLSVLLGFYSWRMIFIGIGLLAFAVAASGFLLIRRRPEDYGFQPVVIEDSLQETIHSGNWYHELIDVVCTRALWPAFAINFGVFGSMYTFTGLWGIPYLRDVYQLERGQAAGYTTVIIIAAAIGGVLFGWLSDAIGKQKSIMIATSLIYAATWAALAFLPWQPGWSGYILFASLGFSSVGCLLTFAYARSHARHSVAGMATSMVNTGTFLGTMLMQPLFGWMLDIGWKGTLSYGVRVYSSADYRRGLLLMLGFAVIAVIGALLATDGTANEDNGDFTGSPNSALKQ